MDLSVAIVRRELVARARERRAGAAAAGDERGERRETALAYGYHRVAR